jgi:splicing factor U2AF subunit
MTPETAAALAPSLIAAAAAAPLAAVVAPVISGLPGPPPLLGGMSMGLSASAFGVPTGGPNAPPSQQATRHARRVYVGGLPPTANEQSIATFFSHALAAVGGNTAGPGNAVVNVYINREKNFSFVEFRTVEETSNAMALDGIMFEGVSVRVRRPNDYNPAAAVGLGPSGPNPNLNLAAIGLGSGAGVTGGVTMAGGNDQAERIFVGGLPYYLTEEQCRELLGSFGPIKSFDLVKDRETGTGKGYGFVVYADPNVTDSACAGLNGLKMGDRTLTVRRAAEGAAGVAGVTTSGTQVFPAVPTNAAAMAAAAAAAVSGVSFPGLSAAPAIAGATRIVVLSDAVTLEEISVEEEYNDILEDMREECSKHGPVENILIPRPMPGNPTPAGLAKVIIVFTDMNGSVKARNAMHGRRFAGRTVTASFLSEDMYNLGQFDQ